MINVTKSFLPPIEEYVEYLKGVWQRGHLTNHGPLVNEFEEKMRDFLGVKHFFYVNNGTIALQIALKALDVKKEVITSPFSYVATTSSIAWENCMPVFADIDPRSFTIDPQSVKERITPDTEAILATHVYGIPCQVEQLQNVAAENGLKVIYDAAHAFGVKYKGKGVLNWGDISTLSFHATKLFHTVEGGGIVTNDDELAHRISYMRNFGHKGQEDFWGIGVNGKSSEFHAAMGLAVFPYLGEIMDKRRELSLYYDSQLKDVMHYLQRPEFPDHVDYNYAYYCVRFPSEEVLLKVRDALNASFVYPRRYFFPSLDSLPYVKSPGKLVAGDISSSVLCLPLYHDLALADIQRICRIIKEILIY